MPSKFHVISGLSSIPGAPKGNVATFPPTTWTPSLLGSNLVAWYKPSTGVTATANRISAMAGVGGVGPTLSQATGSAQMLLTSYRGVAAIQNDGGRSLTAAASGLGLTDASAFSIATCIVVNSALRANFCSFFAWGQRAGQWWQMGFDPVYGDPFFTFNLLNFFGPVNVLSYSPNKANQPLPWPDGSIMTIGITYDGTGTLAGTLVYVNGALMPNNYTGAAAAPGGAANNYAHGAVNLGANNFGFGNFESSGGDESTLVTEFVISKTVLSAATMAQADSYMRQQF